MIKLLILCHVLSDYLLQSDKTIFQKKNKNGKYNLGLVRHLIEVLVPMSILFFFFEFSSTLKLILIISLSHILIDWIKLKLDTILNIKKSALMYLLDQLIHILIIVFITKLIEPIYILENNSSMEELYINVLEYSKLVIVIIYVVWGGGYFIQAFLKGLKIGPPILNKSLVLEKKEALNNQSMGRYIGMLERGILLFFMINLEYSAVGLVIAMKSIARFKQLDNKDFAEYYLIGSLLSITITILGMLVYVKLNW